MVGNLGGCQGPAGDDGVGVLFEGDKQVSAVSSLPKARAYAVKRQDGRVDITALETEFIGK